MVSSALLLVLFSTSNVAQKGMQAGAGMGAPMGPAPGGGMGGGMAPGGGMGGSMMGGGMGMGMGMGGGGGAAGGALSWEETPVPEHLQMTYDEFLQKTGLPRVDVPKAYTLDATGKPAKLSKNEWFQNWKIYQEGAVAAKEAERGMGGPLADKARAELDHIDRENKTVTDLYKWAIEHCFAAEIGYPIMGPVNSGNPNAIGIRIDVLVKCTTKTFPDLVVRRLQPLSTPGWPWREGSSPGRRIGAAAGRGRFDVVTRSGGYWKPAKLYLDAGAIARWNSLWSGTQLTLNLMDTTGKVLQSQAAGAGFDGGTICQQMLYPPYFKPHREIHALPDVSPYGTKQPMFNGARKDLYTMKGWRMGGGDGVRFTVGITELAALNGAEVELVPAAEASAPGIRIGHVGTENSSRKKK
jgi:hypothetical protein